MFLYPSLFKDLFLFFFFNDTATTEIYTLSLHDALPISALARPTLQGILAGALVGAIGLWVRARAAGHLHTQEVLTVTGPYAFTRNPLYLGSVILMIGAAN